MDPGASVKSFNYKISFGFLEVSCLISNCVIAYNYTVGSAQSVRFNHSD